MAPAASEPPSAPAPSSTPAAAGAPAAGSRGVPAPQRARCPRCGAAQGRLADGIEALHYCGCCGLVTGAPAPPPP